MLLFLMLRRERNQVAKFQRGPIAPRRFIIMETRGEFAMESLLNEYFSNGSGEKPRSTSRSMSRRLHPSRLHRFSITGGSAQSTAIESIKTATIGSEQRHVK